MNVLQIADLEIYEAAITELRTQLGHAYVAKFLQKCKPNESDYSVERHKLLANQPDIDRIVERIWQGEADQKKEERSKAERVTAWQNGSLELTDIEIYELALKILIDKFEVYGFIRFFQQHFKYLNGAQPIDRPHQPIPDSDTNVMPLQKMHETEPQD